MLSNCKIKEHITTGEGFIYVKGGKIWYKVSGGGNKTPLVMLHKGPGFPSYYLNPLLALGNERPVIIFDQLGCGRSDRITDTTLMTIDNYIEQLQQLLSALKVEKFYLNGHSWGTILGLDYYLKHPWGIKSLIFVSPCTSLQLWMNDAARPNTVRYYHSLTPNSKFVVIKNAGHDTMQDNPQENIQAIKTFLYDLEGPD